MGRKKKIVEEVVLKPSHYQEAIYDFVEHDVGNLVVEAAAGAGKTSTLLQILRLLPSDKKVLFCAFNKDIVKEITKKVPKDITNVDIRTVHSLGFLMIQRNLKGEEIIPNENKYRQFIYSIITLLIGDVNTKPQIICNFSMKKSNFFRLIKKRKKESVTVW